MGDLVIKAAASNSLKIQSDNATNVLTVGTDDSVTLGTEFKVTSTSQTFTVKGIDAAITDSQTGTTPDTSDSDSGQLAIYNGSTKLWGITEHGYVINPNRPLFQAYVLENPSANEKYSNAEGQFKGVIYNVGNHYDGTKRFTAPIAGHYQFHVSLLTGSAASYGIFRFHINGATWTGSDKHFQVYNYATNNDKTLTASIVLNLSAGDYVSIFIHGTYDHFYWGDGYGYFGGYLIG